MRSTRQSPAPQHCRCPRPSPPVPPNLAPGGAGGAAAPARRGQGHGLMGRLRPARPQSAAPPNPHRRPGMCGCLACRGSLRGRWGCPVLVEIDHEPTAEDERGGSDRCGSFVLRRGIAAGRRREPSGSTSAIRCPDSTVSGAASRSAAPQLRHRLSLPPAVDLHRLALAAILPDPRAHRTWQAAADAKIPYRRMTPLRVSSRGGSQSRKPPTWTTDLAPDSGQHAPPRGRSAMERISLCAAIRAWGHVNSALVTTRRRWPAGSVARRAVGRHDGVEVARCDNLHLKEPTESISVHPSIGPPSPGTAPPVTANEFLVPV
jgi:hypothetical protein